MYGISRSRSDSAITSEPQPGVLAGVRFAGRSISFREGWASVEISAAGAALFVAVLTGQSLFLGTIRTLPGAIKSDRRGSCNRQAVSPLTWLGASPLPARVLAGDGQRLQGRGGGDDHVRLAHLRYRPHPCVSGALDGDGA